MKKRQNGTIPEVSQAGPGPIVRAALAVLTLAAMILGGALADAGYQRRQARRIEALGRAGFDTLNPSAVGEVVHE